MTSGGVKIDRKTLLNRLESFFETHAGDYGIDMAFLYGSWASGDPRDDSDVDLAVRLSSPPSISEKDEDFVRITRLTTELSLNLAREVNILLLAPDFREPMIQYNAIVLGVPVFIREFNQYVRLKMEALNQMEDFSIFGRKWQIEVAEKRLQG